MKPPVDAPISRAILLPTSIEVIVSFEDGVGQPKEEPVGDTINKDDTAEVEFTWTVPNEDKDFLTLTFTIEAKNSDQTEMMQCDTCDEPVSDGKDNDEYNEEFTLVLSAVLGEIEFINTLTERELVRGVPLWMPVVGLGALLALAVPVAVLRRRGGGKKKSKKRDDDEEAAEEGEEQLMSRYLLICQLTNCYRIVLENSHCHTPTLQ